MELQRRSEEPRESDVATLFIGIVRVNGAVQQFTAHRPLDFVLAVDEGANEASLPPGLASCRRREPRIAICFEGNPDAGGVEGYKEGEVP